MVNDSLQLLVLPLSMNIILELVILMFFHATLVAQLRMLHRLNVERLCCPTDFHGLLRLVFHFLVLVVLTWGE